MKGGRTVSGFTLVELLVVLAILGLIVGLVGPQVMRRLGGAKAATADLQIEDLGAALDLFFLDTGRYPTAEEGLDSLLISPGGVDNWNGPYLDKAEVPEDPWGRPFLYRSPGANAVYDLFSYGADGVPGGDSDSADVVSWD